jgi:choline transporter-like protein 2/4/5
MMASSDSAHFVGYKQRHCTDVLCLILFIIFIVIFAFISILAISQGNPSGLIRPSDSLGNLCGQNEFTSRPYQLYFDISKCLTDGVLSFVCPTTKLCVSSCPTAYSDYQVLQTIENTGYFSRNYTRQQLICMYDFNPILDNRTIIDIVNAGLCAPYTVASEPFLGRCLPSVLINLFDYDNNQTLNTNVSVDQINNQVFGIDSLSDVGRVIASDLDKIKESLALFTVFACALALVYMFAVKICTGFVVFLTIIVFLSVLFLCSSFCWYTLYTGQDLVYEYSTVARIVNDFIQLRTLYYIFGCITTFLFILSVLVIFTLFDRIRLSIILLDQGASAVFSVLSTLFWTPFIIILFVLLTSMIIYIEMCLSTVGKPIFRSIVNNETVPCLPNINSTQCIFQQDYGYDSLVLNGTDIITSGVIEFLVDNEVYFRWFNLFAFLWFGAFLFAFEEIVLAGVFSHYYWSKERLTTSFPLIYSVIIVIRYHLGSIAFGSLIIALLRYIRMILDYINEKVSKIQPNVVMNFILKCFSCFLWIFEKFIKFLNKNSYVLIASRGYSFCKATRKAFVYIVTNCLRFLVLVHLTEWILFCGIISVCACNTYLFYQYLQWTDEFDQLILRWTPIVVIVLITYLICSLFFSVYDMAIKTLFVCFLQDLDENDGSIQRPYVMNNELLRLVHKTNNVEKNENKQQTDTHK